MMILHQPHLLTTDLVLTVAAGVTLGGSVATHALLQEQAPSTFTSNAVLIIAAGTTLVTAITVMVGSLVGLIKVISELKQIKVNQVEAAVQQQATHVLVNSLSEARVTSAHAEGVTAGVEQEKQVVAEAVAAADKTAVVVAAAIEQEREHTATLMAAAAAPTVAAPVEVVNQEPVPVRIEVVQTPPIPPAEPPASTPPVLPS